MAVMTMVIGQSGTGKSASLRNLTTKAAIINVSGKPFPFKAKVDSFKTDDYAKIQAAIQQATANGRKIIVIDDATYLMVDEFMRTAKVPGYQKFTDLAQNFFNLVKFCAALPDDITVYFIGHSVTDENGNEKFKTIGKLIDEKITLEGLFTIVVKTVVNDTGYYFSTKNNGADTVKAPMDMFEGPLVENDLAVVDDTIRKFYGIEEKKNGKPKS